MQSPDWMQSDVQTRLRLQGSSKRVLDVVDIGVNNNKTENTASISVYLKAGSPRENKQIPKGECLKAFVEIIYPRSLPGTGSLDITTGAGTITVKMDKPEATFHSIALSSILGDIILDGVHVQKRTSARAVKGNVSGMVKTTGEVNVEVEKGTINLSVDDAPNVHGWDPSTLDVKLSTVYGTVDLKQVSAANGECLLVLRSMSCYPCPCAHRWRLFIYAGTALPRPLFVDNKSGQTGIQAFQSVWRLSTLHIQLEQGDCRMDIKEWQGACQPSSSD